MCVMREFNKNNAIFFSAESKKKGTLATEYIRNPLCPTRPRAERLINLRAFPERTVMKMPPEYFTCPFNTSQKGWSGGAKSENGGEEGDTKEKLLYSRCRNRARRKRTVKESLFHLCVRYTLCPARSSHL